MPHQFHDHPLSVLAQGSGDELTQLKADGYDFHHIDSTYLDFSCTSCHTGGLSK